MDNFWRGDCLAPKIVFVSRFLVVFRSHREGLADEHFVDVEADHALEAVWFAAREAPPFWKWEMASAQPWPKGCRTIDQAVASTGTDG